MVDKEVIDRVEQQFITICKNNFIKYESKKFYEYQAMFFSGATIALNEVPPRWGIGLMGNRPIVEKWK